MLNKALRNLEIDTIVNIGFFLQDLHKCITTAYNEQSAAEWCLRPFTVYRGQALLKTHLDQMKTAQGGLLSFNCFLSTSTTKDISHMFSESRAPAVDTVGVIFEIHVDPTVKSTQFANINTMSAIPDENEILFTMHSVFRIDDVKLKSQSTDIWEVTLTMTQDADPQLAVLTDYIRTDTESYDGWYRLAIILSILAQHKSAQKLWEILLHQADSDEKTTVCLNELGHIYKEIDSYSAALSNYEKALDITQKFFPPDHSRLGTAYHNIGSVYYCMGEYSKSLTNHEKALEIRRISLPSDHLAIASSYQNIGLIYAEMRNYSESLSNYEKARDTGQKSLPDNHPGFAMLYISIGSVYFHIGDYSKSITNYEKALEIQQKSLPPDHPDLAILYNKLALAYFDIGEYSESLSYEQKALKIQQKSHSDNHYNISISYNIIGAVYFKMGEYSESLSNCEKALEIRQKSLPPDHADLAKTYNEIGLVYFDMGRYEESLSNYEKALESQQKYLPSDHPDLSRTYSIMAKARARMQR